MVRKISSLRMALVLIGAGLAMAGGCTNFVANSHNADGVTLFQRGQYQDALQKFQEATYADPNNADGYYNLGATYHRLGQLRNQPDSLARAENLLPPVPGAGFKPSRLSPGAGRAVDRGRPQHRGLYLDPDVGGPIAVVGRAADGTGTPVL